MIPQKVARLLRHIAYWLDPSRSLPAKPHPSFRSMLIFDDLDPEFKDYYDKCIDFTMTTVERLYALYTAVNYIVSARIPGAFVECGVWRGGSSMMSALRLNALGETNRILYLYDTYAGMSEPTEADVNVAGQLASHRWRTQFAGDKNLWDYAPLDDVQKNMQSTGYPEVQIKFIKGEVESTLQPATLPDRIALLRLDTDWYKSTYHEMVHLYPRLSPGGVLIIDDYGHWQGARKAVDQYLAENGLDLYLHRIDYTGRVAIKPGLAKVTG